MFNAFGEKNSTPVVRHAVRSGKWLEGCVPANTAA